MKHFPPLFLAIRAPFAAVVAVASVVSAQQEDAQLPSDRQMAVFQLPHASPAFDAIVTSDSRIHAVYAAEVTGERTPRPHYAVREPAADAWSDPRPIPTDGHPVTLGGLERRPRLVVTPRGAIAVAWQSRESIAFARSTDRGDTWTFSRVRDEVPGDIDMLSMALGPEGEITLAWNDSRGHAERNRFGGDEFSTGLWAATSTDGGQTFAPNICLNADAPRACVCCAPDIAYDDTGALWAAYRSSDANIKEIAVLRRDAAGGTTSRLISADRWEFRGCPMNGPEIAVSPDGRRVAVIWNHESAIEAAYSADSGLSWSAPRRLATGALHDAARVDGTPCLAWSDGPQTFAAPFDGLGRPLAWDTAVAFVQPDGKRMLLVTSP